MSNEYTLYARRNIISLYDHLQVTMHYIIANSKDHYTFTHLNENAMVESTDYIDNDYKGDKAEPPTGYYIVTTFSDWNDLATKCPELLLWALSSLLELAVVDCTY